MTKMHPQRCTGSPCDLRHDYICPNCSEPFSTTSASHRAEASGVVKASPFWPVCSVACLVDYLGSNALTYPDLTDDEAGEVRAILDNQEVPF